MEHRYHEGDGMAEAIVRNQGDGERLWFLGGGVMTWKANAEETGESMLVFEDELAGGKVTPLHFHPDVDEALYVLEGELLLHGGDKEITLGPGGFAFAPRGEAHAFMVTSPTARLLCIQTPGSAQPFYREASVPLDASGAGPVDFERIGAAAASTGATTIVGPPPFQPRQLS
jgi:quercetin dioxygenase-like cupin family protein